MALAPVPANTTFAVDANADAKAEASFEWGWLRVYNCI